MELECYVCGKKAVVSEKGDRIERWVVAGGILICPECAGKISGPGFDALVQLDKAIMDLKIAISHMREIRDVDLSRKLILRAEKAISAIQALRADVKYRFFGRF